mgnify:CR=1 FL=1|tara:strand:+ start:1268 stop:1456 length:189 start_codon:yes stop_codon:yes gene_type:complete
MIYTQNQVDDVISVTGAELFINHVLGIYSEAVATGMQLSNNSDGLTARDIETIKNIMDQTSG